MADKDGTEVVAPASDSVRRSQFAEFVPVWHSLGKQERDVLIYLAKRLKKGQDQYGELALLDDPRNLETERAEELGDLLVYTAMAAVQRALRAIHGGK
jgi:hypothetical protein